MNILTFSQVGHRKLEFFVDRSVDSGLFLPLAYSGSFSAPTSGSDQYVKYKCDDGSSDAFMNILVYLRSNDWTAVTSTAHNDASSQKLIKTFYFERPSDVVVNVEVVDEADTWVEMQDNGDTYYYNTITGESAWEKPVMASRTSMGISRDSIPTNGLSPGDIAAAELKVKQEREEEERKAKEEKERKEREEKERLERERKEREEKERKEREEKERLERERKEREEKERKEKERKEVEERERREREERERRARELKELKEKEEKERKEREEREAKKDLPPVPPKYELNSFRIPGGGSTPTAKMPASGDSRPMSSRTRTVNAPPPPDLSKRPSLGSEAGVPPPPGVSPQKRLSQGGLGGVFAPPPPGGGRRLSSSGLGGPPPPPPGQIRGAPPSTNTMSLSSTSEMDATDAIASKNAEHFRKMAEQEEEEKAALERQRRAKMSAEELQEEQQAMSVKEEHEKQKAQAMARLGGTFATSRGGAALFSGGRGRGRGRRGGI